ncbi:hypothetical protein A2U01_0057136, partial [Trifolium medium]|nr:hypothetical protein [Trifolium medium]
MDQPGPAGVGDLSKTDDEVDNDIHSHFNRPPPKRVPKKGGETVGDARPSLSGRHDGRTPSDDESGSSDAFPCVRHFRWSWSRRHFKRKPRANFLSLSELSPSE